jgi:hypothetical protein
LFSGGFRIVSPLAAKKINLFFLPTCAGEKTLLSAQVCERSECMAVRCKIFSKRRSLFEKDKKEPPQGKVLFCCGFF